MSIIIEIKSYNGEKEITVIHGAAKFTEKIKICAGPWNIDDILNVVENCIIRELNKEEK